MSRTHAILLALLAMAPSAARAQSNGGSFAPTPTLEEIFGKPPLTGERPADAAVSADGSWCLFRLPSTAPLPASAPAESGAESRPSRAGKWILARTDGSVQKFFDFQGRRPTVFRFAKTGREVLFVDGKRILAADPDRPLEAAREVLGAQKELDSVSFHDDGRILYRTEAGWYLLSPGEDSGRFLTSRRDASRFVWSDDGSRAVFVAPEEQPASSPESRPAGGPRSRPARARTNRSSRQRILAVEPGSKSETVIAAADVDQRIHLSRDGRFLAFASTAEEPGQPHMIPDYLTSRVSTRPARSSQVSDLVPVRSVRWAEVREGAEPKALDLPGEDRRHVRGIEFAPAGSRLLVQVESATHHERWLVGFELPDAAPRVLYQERDSAWIGSQTALFESSGERVLFVSDRSGYLHLYSVPFAGGEPKALTRGDYEVLSVQRIGKGPDLLLATSEGSSSERRLTVIGEDGGARREVPAARGFPTNPVASADGSTVVFLHGDLFVPGDLHAAPVADASAERGAVRLTDTVPDVFEGRQWRHPDEVRVRSSDGTAVAAHVHRPLGERPSAGWPAVIFLHGAGYLQNVSRSMTSYEVNLLFHQRLADKGYVVMNPDFRGSSGYGRKFRTDVYKDLGGPEREDVKACKRWLVEKEGVNADRVGIYGGSYGGFLTLMLLFKDPKEFACGAALRPVTDWSTYHPGYTQPRLGNPKDDPEAYRRTSPIHFAEALERPLLILHGMMDSNVFVQDSVRLIEKLIKLGKDFDAMLYPSQEHAFTDPASWVDEYRRIEKFFDEHLKGTK